MHARIMGTTFLHQDSSKQLYIHFSK